jgi:hypothetical protein
MSLLLDNSEDRLLRLVEESLGGEDYYGSNFRHTVDKDFPVVKECVATVRRLMDQPGSPSLEQLRASAGQTAPFESASTTEAAVMRYALEQLPPEAQWAAWLFRSKRFDPKLMERENPVLLVALRKLDSLAKSLLFHRREGALSELEFTPPATPDFSLDDVDPYALVDDRMPAEQRKDWESLVGCYVPKLQPVMNTYLTSPDPTERERAFRALDKYRRKKSDGAFSGSSGPQYDDNRNYSFSEEAKARRMEALGG